MASYEEIQRNIKEVHLLLTGLKDFIKDIRYYLYKIEETIEKDINSQDDLK